MTFRRLSTSVGAWRPCGVATVTRRADERVKDIEYIKLRLPSMLDSDDGKQNTSSARAKINRDMLS